ncbi:C3-binding domain-containing protein [Staphylococcus pseudintermedius]|uniref:C3-binding domain-containing protein n=1 Tax=Staphylococcus pseudintermedius TaxID=283734 RepID=UPI002A245D46|nr:C3-binding domain-containing protein [Staphylococcus pseudintermedius]
MAPKAESHEDRLIELQNKNLMEANEALKALQQEDSIQNRRAAQRAVNKLTPDSANAFQKELDQINAPRDAKIKADAEAKKQAPEVSAPQIEDAPTTEVAPSPKPNETQEEQKPNVSTPEKDTKTEKTEEAKEKDTNKADAEKKPEVDKSSKTEKNTQSEKAPKVEGKEQAEKATENNKGADTKKEMQPAPSTENNGNNNAVAPSSPAPVLPETGKATTSTLESYWNAFKDSVNKGYAYVKNSITSGLQYLKGQYDYITGKYNDAKYYTELYKNHKNLIDVTVLGFLNENGISAHITPLKINEKDNLLSKSYAHTRNFVTESINTGKVLYTLYKNPTVLNTAIKAAETANTAKNLFNGFLSIFK